MNYALIFASGIGSRMNSEIPKQFIQVNNKPIIVHTIEVFQKSQFIDNIVVVTLDKYISNVKEYVNKFGLSKVSCVIKGGKTAMESQFNGLKYINMVNKDSKSIVFIHDGVRPFINEKLISDCLILVKEKGSAITVSPASETIGILNNENQIKQILPRQFCMFGRAPQVFYVDEIYHAHLKALSDNKSYIDSASMMLDQGAPLNVIEGPAENIKITTQYDLMLCKLWMSEKYE